MGTYIYYKLKDPSGAERINSFFEVEMVTRAASTGSEERWENHVPHVNTQADLDWEMQRYGEQTQKLGSGFTKISGWVSTPEDTKLLGVIVDILVQAKLDYGLIIEHLPSNAEDYLTAEQCDNLEPRTERNRVERRIRAQESKWEKAKESALRELRLQGEGGGVLILPRAGTPGGWLSVLFAKVDTLRLRQFYYNIKGSSYWAAPTGVWRSETFETGDAVQTLLAPLLEIGEPGSLRLIQIFTQIPFSCYSTAPLMSLLAGAYHMMPAAQQVRLHSLELLDQALTNSSALEGSKRPRVLREGWLHYKRCDYASWSMDWDYRTDAFKLDKDYNARYGPMTNVYFTREKGDSFRSPVTTLNRQALAAFLWKLEDIEKSQKLHNASKRS